MDGLNDMKILILGCYYSANLGDGVICECVADQILRAFPNAEIMIRDLWHRSAFDNRQKRITDFKVSDKQLVYRRLRGDLYKFITRFLHWDVQFISTQNRLHESQAHLDRVCATECDLVVFAGGQMFMDAYSLRLWYVIRHFEEKGIPVILNACGLGPTYSKKLRSHLREALSAPNVLAASCRDDVQGVNKYYSAAGEIVQETFDPALGCSKCYGITKERAAEVIGLGIMGTSRISPKYALRFWHELILELEKKGIPWRVFVNGEKIDIAFARYVIETLPGSKRCLEDCIVPIPVVPQQLVETISQFRSIISFRLHSHIIATSLDIPSVAVVWDDKVRIFFEKIGHPERCCTLQSSPYEVMEKLIVAEREGYDRSLIEKQKRFSKEWLINAINEASLKRQS